MSHGVSAPQVASRHVQAPATVLTITGDVLLTYLTMSYLPSVPNGDRQPARRQREREGGRGGEPPVRGLRQPAPQRGLVKTGIT